MVGTPTIPLYRCGDRSPGDRSPWTDGPEEGPREGRHRQLRPDPAPPTAHRCG